MIFQPDAEELLNIGAVFAAGQQLGNSYLQLDGIFEIINTLRQETRNPYSDYLAFALTILNKIAHEPPQTKQDSFRTVAKIFASLENNDPNLLTALITQLVYTVFSVAATAETNPQTVAYILERRIRKQLAALEKKNPDANLIQ